MFEAVNKGFGAVRCETVISESPSASAVADVVTEYYRVAPLLVALREQGINPWGGGELSEALRAEVRRTRAWLPRWREAGCR